MGRLQGKVALITGAGAGIGRAAARLFALEGARIVIAELEPEAGRATEKQVREVGGEAHFVEMDVTDDAQVERAVSETIEGFGKFDVRYNCAGGSMAEDAPVTTVAPWIWDHTIGLDLKGTFLCCRHAIPKLVEAGGGAVVDISSLASLRGVPTHVYSAAKGGVISLTRSLAASYSGQGVRVNAICPGFVLSERVRGRFGLGDRADRGALSLRRGRADRHRADRPVPGLRRSPHGHRRDQSRRRRHVRILSARKPSPRESRTGGERCP